MERQLFRTSSILHKEEEPESPMKNKAQIFRTLKRFFSSFLNNISESALTADDVELKFKTKQNLTRDEFLDAIACLDPGQDRDKVTQIFNLLSKDEVLIAKKFIKEMKSALESSESESESSEVSSPSEGDFVEQEVLFQKVQEIFELVAFKVKFFQVPRERFVGNFQEKCGPEPEGRHLSQFFLIKDWRVEDGPSRNMLVTYLLSSPSCDLVSLLISKCFIDIPEEPFPENPDFLMKCRKKDSRKTRHLPWSQIRQVLEDLGIVPTLGLKFHFFSLEQSLDYIPYSN